MTIFGWDMSHYDAHTIGDAVAEGISFITHKAGGDAPDAEIVAWWNGVNTISSDRCLLGAYWVLYPGRPADRADAFLSRLDAACPGWRDRPFILQVDCEMWGGDSATKPGLADIRAFCDRLAVRMPRLRPIVYAPKWAYGDSLTGLAYPLWASSYVSGSGGFKALYPGDRSSRWAAYSGQVPAILQYSSFATIGGQSTSDANAYQGTLAQLTALVAPGWSDDMDQATFNERMDAWWNARMDPDAADNRSRKFLRVAPWHQLVGNTGKTAHNVLFGDMMLLLQKAADEEQVDPVALANAVAATLPQAQAQQLLDALAARLAT